VRFWLRAGNRGFGKPLSAGLGKMTLGFQRLWPFSIPLGFWIRVLLPVAPCSRPLGPLTWLNFLAGTHPCWFLLFLPCAFLCLEVGWIALADDFAAAENSGLLCSCRLLPPSLLANCPRPVGGALHWFRHPLREMASVPLGNVCFRGLPTTPSGRCFRCLFRFGSWPV